MTDSPTHATDSMPPKIERALARLSDADEAGARRAFAILADDARLFLSAFLRRECGVGDAAEREDLIQETLTRLWAARRSFRSQGAPAWRAYARHAARRLHIDRLRSHGRLPTDAEYDVERIPREERPLVDALLEAAEAATLFAAADVVLLGLDPSVAGDGHARRVLAAQLFYLDGEPWERVVRLLGTPPPSEPSLTRERLDHYLADPGVLRHLTFAELYWGADRLVAHLLNGGSDGGGATWPPNEEQAIRWRFGSGMLLEHILSRRDCALSRDALVALFDRCRARFPFEMYLAEIAAALTRRGAATAPLNTPGIWQRLAFEYRYRDGLPHKDIEDRTAPPAAVVGYRVTAAMLNVWLSNARLLRRVGAWLTATDSDRSEEDGDGG